MTRMDFYFVMKNVLCKYGAIPRSEKDYEKLITEMYAKLMDATNEQSRTFSTQK